MRPDLVTPGTSTDNPGMPAGSARRDRKGPNDLPTQEELRKQPEQAYPATHVPTDRGLPS